MVKFVCVLKGVVALTAVVQGSCTLSPFQITVLQLLSSIEALALALVLVSMLAPPVVLGGVTDLGEVISRARIDIDAMKLMVLQAAKAMDVLGNKEARVYVSAVKAMVPERVCQIIDQAIQMHGATGISQWSPLAGMYADQRHLRFADGPDEVHHMVVGRAEVQKYDLW